MKNLIKEAIDVSIAFEELMDKTDFDSWLEGDNSVVLDEYEQDITPFNKYEGRKKKLENICCEMVKRGSDKLPIKGNISSVEEYIVYHLYSSKRRRIEARKCFEPDKEKKEYKNAIYHLSFALSELQKMKVDNTNQKVVNTEKKWEILLYNDLSICYAGLENSSMSRGYAEESKNIMEDETSFKYKEFFKKVNADTTTISKDIRNCNFFSSRLYDLYTIALYNQALAEKRSHSYNEAERTFWRIIKYAEKIGNGDYPLRNFNYYSALLILGELYIDLGRGKEAINVLKKIEKDENDIRYWNACITEIHVLIDQSMYEKAEQNLRDKSIFEEEMTPVRRHRITSTGFKGLYCFVRCKIEIARDDLKEIDETKMGDLNNAIPDIERKIKIMSKREQTGYKIKAYRQLSDIHIILRKSEKDKNEISTYNKKVISYLVKFISEDKIDKDELNEFNSDSRKDDWIDKCDDIDVLENFADQIITIIKDEPKDCIKESLVKKYGNLLKEIKKKIINECEDKGQLSRAEKISKKIDEVLGKKNDIEFQKDIFPEKSCDSKNNLTKKILLKRLDINEKEFDTVLFERSKLKEKKHLAEVIILRRWNSFSPGLHKESKGSLGGGYLLRIKRDNSNDSDNKEENIVIDPGYNFLQNLRREGFYINDIDTIIVTHSHLDHCSDLLSVMDLLYQYNKRYKDTPPKPHKEQRKKINLCLSKGAYSKFSTYIDDPDWNKQLKDVIILENLEKMKYVLYDGLITISAIQTPHMDLGGAKSIGLKIKIRKEEKNLCIGFTSDTPWYQDILENFEGCDLLCVHMGGIKYQEIGYTEDRYNIKSESREILKNPEKEFKNKFSEANHLLFHGTLGIIKHYSSARHIKEYKDKYDKDKPLIIVGEFGEELKYGLRTGICEELKNQVKNKRNVNKDPDIYCLPGDIGLYIGIDGDFRKKVRCNFCDEFVEQKEIEIFIYGREDAIHYICKTCSNTLSELQKQAVIDHRITRH